MLHSPPLESMEYGRLKANVEVAKLLLGTRGKRARVIYYTKQEVPQRHQSNHGNICKRQYHLTMNHM